MGPVLCLSAFSALGLQMQPITHDGSLSLSLLNIRVLGTELRSHDCTVRKFTTEPSSEFLADMVLLE